MVDSVEEHLVRLQNLLGEAQIYFSRILVVLSVKRVGADLMEFALPEITEAEYAKVSRAQQRVCLSNY